MDYLYRINPNLHNQSFTLTDIPINMQPNQLYNLDARCNGDAQTKSGELRNAMSKGWIQRVEHEKPKKIKQPKVEVKPKPKVDTPQEPTAEEIKATKVFNTALDMGAIKKVGKGFECVNPKGTKVKFKNQAAVIKRMLKEPAVMEHIQKLCQG